MGLNTTTVFGWAQRYAAEGDEGYVFTPPCTSPNEPALSCS